MISRATCIPKFNTFFRQISTSVTIYNRKVANVEELSMSQQSQTEKEASKSHQTNAK